MEQNLGTIVLERPQAKTSLDKIADQANDLYQTYRTQRLQGLPKSTSQTIINEKMAELKKAYDLAVNQTKQVKVLNLQEA